MIRDMSSVTVYGRHSLDFNSFKDGVILMLSFFIILMFG